MAFRITRRLAASRVTYLYEDAGVALRKVRTIQRNLEDFDIEDGLSGVAMTLADLEVMAGERLRPTQPPQADRF